MSEQRLMHHRWRADAEFAALSLGARDLFYGLMGICDSWGCLKVNPVPIRNEAYLGAERLPELPLVVDRLTELREVGFLRCWEDGDKTYAELKWFMGEQRIRYRRQRETPVPPWRDDDGSATGKTPATQRNLENASDAAKPRKRQRRSPAEEKRREEKRGEENPPPAPGGTVLESESGGPESAEEGAKPWDGDLLDPGCKDVQTLLGVEEDAHDVQKAWAAILLLTGKWGKVRWMTLLALHDRVVACPERALAAVLDIAAKPALESPWGALSHAMKKKWCPTDANLQRAKEMIRGSPGIRKDGTQTIGEILEETK